MIEVNDCATARTFQVKMVVTLRADPLIGIVAAFSVGNFTDGAFVDETGDQTVYCAFSFAVGTDGAADLLKGKAALRVFCQKPRDRLALFGAINFHTDPFKNENYSQMLL